MSQSEARRQRREHARRGCLWKTDGNGQTFCAICGAHPTATDTQEPTRD